MGQLLLIAVLVFLSSVTPAYGKKPHYEAVVAEPYLELHTGPGRGFPVFHVVDRGERIEVLKRRTDWFRVRAANGTEGWVKLEEFTRTLDTAGLPVRVEDPDAEGYAARRWEAGVGLGELDGASVIAVYGSYHWTRNLSTELRLTDISGDFSTGWMATAHVVHQPFPEWRISPYASLGTGVIRIDPRATLVQTEDRTDQVGQVGVGLRMHLTRRFMLRAEYNSYLVFTSREDNEELDEWKAGFAFFF
ncbi:MAG: SH3 domain-containing protein [Gammaproteobacteria bacterium]|nr:SH3 domain-containing protein [Gammaproteobacteria bacterium]